MWKTTVRRFCAEVDIRAIKGGGDADCIASFMTGAHMLVVLYEYCAREYGRRARMAPLICDETHMLGGNQTQRYTPERICPVDELLLPTATPCANSRRVFGRCSTCARRARQPTAGATRQGTARRSDSLQHGFTRPVYRPSATEPRRRLLRRAARRRYFKPRRSDVIGIALRARGWETFVF